MTGLTAVRFLPLESGVGYRTYRDDVMLWNSFPSCNINDRGKRNSTVRVVFL